MENWTAYYQPTVAPGKEDPTKSGFESREAAQQYALDNMCSICIEARRRALAGETDDDPESDVYIDEFPGCYFEWLILPTDKVTGNYEEMMEAAGWKKSWPKD